MIGSSRISLAAPPRSYMRRSTALARTARTYAARLAERFQQDAIHVRAVTVETLDENAS